ncbi:hypothetical protein B0I35DRAFT_443545 [Stachybotrys elegans]|uniref:Mid2 domain-containing protein n=1 Tax=Stachybotrys elegans TaxID=80388 RepID=A0A8K0SGS2_9HYPO|nr:hypothetical protein B0I35DRAFT_443545 [Stachybotrys elegans]
MCLVKMVLLRSTIYLSTLILFLDGAACICYYPDGSTAPQDVPCTDETRHSACCGPGYACLSNFICQATGAELQRPGATEYVRGSCTDESWRSGSCPSFCVNPNYDFLAGGNGIGRCENDSLLFYCINSQETDCQRERNVLVFHDEPLAITTIGVRATTSITPVTLESPTVESLVPVTSTTSMTSTRTTSTSTGRPEPVPGSEDEEGSTSNALPIGLGVGLGVGSAAFVAVAAFYWKRHRAKDRGHNQPTAVEHNQEGNAHHETKAPLHAIEPWGIAELHSQPTRYELG